MRRKTIEGRSAGKRSRPSDSVARQRDRSEIAPAPIDIQGALPGARDLAPIIARVLVEHPPALMSTSGTVIWIFRTWPGCSGEEALRAIEIADELHALDCMTRGV